MTVPFHEARMGHCFYERDVPQIASSPAEIARRVGLTRARVTQIMNLRWLNPRLQKRLIDPTSPREQSDRLTLRGLRLKSHWQE